MQVLFPISAILCRILTSRILRAELLKASLKAKGHTKLKNSFCLTLRVFQSQIRPKNIFFRLLNLVAISKVSNLGSSVTPDYEISMVDLANVSEKRDCRYPPLSCY